jgi:hypothetical protein
MIGCMVASILPTISVALRFLQLSATHRINAVFRQCSYRSGEPLRHLKDLALPFLLQHVLLQHSSAMAFDGAEPRHHTSC